MDEEEEEEVSDVPQFNISYKSAERMSKWISWVLKVGFRELGVKVDQGWVKLQALADVMSANLRRELGEFDGPMLEAYVTQMDDVGRFQVEKGWLSKVPHGQRQPQPRPWPNRTSGWKWQPAKNKQPAEEPAKAGKAAFREHFTPISKEEPAEPEDAPSDDSLMEEEDRPARDDAGDAEERERAIKTEQPEW